MIVTECQEVLHDKRKSGKERPWALYKLSNGYVAMAYDEVDKLKAERLRNCASWLEFTKTEGGLKLHNANFAVFVCVQYVNGDVVLKRLVRFIK